MRWRAIFLLFLLCRAVVSLSQNVVSAEYFINTDPGYGNATQLTFTAAPDVGSINFNVDIEALAMGFHHLYVRVKDENGKWSQTNVKPFYKEKVYTSLPNIVKAEYFLNTDPGFGNGTDVAIIPGQDITDISFAVELSSLDNGFHHLYVRVKDAHGRWSLTNVKPFYKETVYTELPNIVKAENFIDTDPGFDGATNITITPGQDITNIPFVIDLSSIEKGFHHLYVRVKDAHGRWSLTNVKPFYKETVYTELPNIVKAEYFINTDPGFGNATNIAITPGKDITNISFAVELSSLDNGFHHLYVRVQDAHGRWSLTNVKPFYKETVYTELPNIVKAEYFINTDPGFGNATNIAITPGQDITDISLTIDLSSLENGFHHFYARVMDAHGRWSLTNVKPFYKETFYAELQNIVKVEYFINTDPGFGNGIDVPITPTIDTGELGIIADVSGLPLGTHYLFIRVKDINGNWSLTNIKSFDVNCADLTVDFIAADGCSGSSHLISDNSSNVYPLAQYHWNFGDGTPVVIADKGDIEHTFTASGIYNVTLVVHNSSECIDSTTKSITINASPGIPATPTGSTSVCKGSTGTNYSTTGASNATSYEWELSPTTAGIISGNSTTGTVAWAADFVGTAKVRVKGINPNCTGDFSAWRNITVNPLSEGGTLTATNTIICQGVSTGTLSLVGHVGNVIRWEKQKDSEGWQNISRTATYYSETPTEAGVWQYRVLVKSGACEGVYSSVATVTVHSLPVAYNVIGGGNYCAGGSGVEIKLSNSENGFQYKLYRGGSNLVATVTGTGGEISFGLHQTAGIYTVIGENPGSSCTTQMNGNVSVSIDPLPIVSVSKNTEEVCEGSTLTLTANYSHGTLAWNHGIENGVAFTPTENKTYTATVTSSYGCGIASANVDVTVHGLPTVDAGPDVDFCAGNQVTLTATYSNGVLSWDKGVQNGVPFVPVGLQVYTATVTSQHGCGYVNDLVTVISHEAPTVIAQSTTTDACKNQEITLTANYDHVQGDLSWSHGVTNGMPFNIQETTTYTATVVSPYGCGTATDDITVNVTPAPTVSVVADYAICAGTPTTLTATFEHGTLQWNHGVTNGVEFTPTETRTYTATVTNACGVATEHVTITVNPLPANAGTISGDAVVCQGQNSVTYSVPAIANATSYVWTLPEGATGSSTTNSITVDYGTSAASGNITVKGVNSCGDGAVSIKAISVNLLPVAAGTISGNETVCQGQTSVTYSVPTIANATSYVWTLPSGATGSSSTNSINVDYGTSAVSGNITVKGVSACGSGAISTLAITVNPLPAIAGTISGDVTVCQGQNLVTYSVPTIEHATSYVWTLPNGATGTSSTNSIDVDYGTSAVSGNITVRGKNSCGNGVASTLAVTVNPLPAIAGAITGQANVCQGQTAVTYSVPTIAYATSYVWTLPSGATGASTTNTIVIDFANTATSGDITVKGTNSCGDGAISAKAITVSPMPVPAGIIAGKTTVCQGETAVTYTVPEIANAISYIWTLPDGAIGTSTTNTISIDYGLSAISGDITVKGTNACSDGEASTLAITVNPLPVAAGAISGNTAVCQGETAVTYTVPEIENATSYVWTLPTGATGASSTNSITVDFGVSAISGNITVKGVNSCGDGAVSTLAISIDALPDMAGTITGETTVCQGQTAVTYTVPEIANATSYVWTLPSGATGTSTTNTITVDYGNSAISGEISVYGTSGCGNGTSSTLSITVNLLPDISGTITGNTTVCQGETAVTYTVPEIANATSYVWTLPNGATGSSSTNSIDVDYGTSAVSGNITVRGKNSCGNGVASTLEVTVNPLPAMAGAITGQANVCQGQTAVTYTVPEIANATSYVWTLPSGVTGASTTNTIVVDFSNTATSGDITVKGTNSCGDGAISAKAITVSPMPAPAGIIAGKTTVCQGETTVTYTVPEIANAISYIWTLPDGAIGTSTTNTISVDYGLSAISGDITVKGTNACSDGEVSTLAITVNPLPAVAGAISGNTAVCQGETGVTYTVPEIENATSYVWTLPTGATGASSTNSITVDFGVSAISGNITVKGVNSCGDGAVSTLAISIDALPDIAGTITGEATVCQGQTAVTYTVPEIANATSYVWTLPSGATGTSTTNTITVDYGNSAISGDISVYGTSGCGNGTSSTLSITVNLLPDIAGTITGNTTVCQGETAVTYTVSEIANATSYVWTLPNGETGTSTTNTITINFENSATSGEISVCGVNECGAGENSTLAITVNALPSEAGAITGNTNVCQGETGVTYIVSEIANATSYVWTLPTGATGSSSTNSITVDFGVSAISGNITVKGVNSCGDGAMSTLAISIDALPDIAGIITGETTVCQGQTAVTYTVPEIANATSYVWTLPSGATGESTTNTITVDYGNSAISGDISVYGTSGCGNGTSSTLSITVNLLPDIAGTITGNTTVCQGETAVTYTVPEIANATSYIWTLPNGATGTSTTNTITVNFENSATSGEISVCGVNECGTGENSTLAITVNSLPSEAGAITGNTNVCQGETGVTYTVPEIANATSYVWTLPTGATGASSTNSIIVDFGVSAISGNITVKGVNSCGDGAMSTLAISIDALPDIAGTITGETTVCQGQTAVAYTVPEIANATSYVWILPNGATGESITNTIIVDYGSSAISGEISVYGVNNCGDGAVSTITITVNPLPDIAGTISGDTMICQGQSSVTYSVPTIANAISYIWTLPEGATGTSTTNSIDVDYGTSAVSGNITVKGVNACGDGESSTLAITVNPLPVKPIITSNSSSHDNSYYCQNDTLVCVNFDNNLLYEWFKDGTEIVTEFSNNAIPLQTSGGYSVKCTDEQTGCHISSDIYEVQVNPVSTLIVHEKHQSEVISLLIVDNKENLFVDYLWSLGDGSDIPSDIVNNRQFVVLPPQHMGKNYMVKVTDIYGCKINSDIISTSLKDFFITLYPTITNSISNVLINHPYEGIIQMRIIDMKGTVISTIDLNKVKSVATFELNFSHLPAGIYTVIFQLGNYTDSHKLFKE